ncbi:centromere protein R [Acipenser ruthenus]|uniref:centromere protein R n=1 Tax=Acipenser ruthenus TaxID=7906 RepID=UPI00274069A8|nr:centromere protein R [Acipenser ruthenus]
MSRIPVKRALQLLDETTGENKNNEETPAKKQRRTGTGTFSPMTGTCHLSLMSTPPAVSKGVDEARSRGMYHKSQMDNSNALRSKVEKCVQAFQDARSQLKHLQALEGSSELGNFFRRGSADLEAELLKNRELVAQVEKGLKQTGTGPPKAMIPFGSSYEFLKSILN